MKRDTEEDRYQEDTSHKKPKRTNKEIIVGKFHGELAQTLLIPCIKIPDILEEILDPGDKSESYWGDSDYDDGIYNHDQEVHDLRAEKLHHSEIFLTSTTIPPSSEAIHYKEWPYLFSVAKSMEVMHFLFFNSKTSQNTLYTLTSTLFFENCVYYCYGYSRYVFERSLIIPFTDISHQSFIIGFSENYANHMFDTDQTQKKIPSLGTVVLPFLIGIEGTHENESQLGLSLQYALDQQIEFFGCERKEMAVVGILLSGCTISVYIMTKNTTGKYALDHISTYFLAQLSIALDVCQVVYNVKKLARQLIDLHQNLMFPQETPPSNPSIPSSPSSEKQLLSPSGFLSPPNASSMFPQETPKPSLLSPSNPSIPSSPSSENQLLYPSASTSGSCFLSPPNASSMFPQETPQPPLLSPANPSIPSSPSSEKQLYPSVSTSDSCSLSPPNAPSISTYSNFKFDASLIIYQTREAKVYKGKDTTTGKEVVLKKKIWYSYPHQPSEIQTLFFLEGRNHTCKLISYYLVEKDEEWEGNATYTCVFEYIEHKNPQSKSELQQYMLHLLRALAYCHSKGIIHRDVKLGNVLRAANSGATTLIDFEIAITLGQAKYSFGGTLDYLPPELHQQGRSCNFSFQGDIWSAGVVFVKLLLSGTPTEEWQEEIFANLDEGSMDARKAYRQKADEVEIPNKILNRVASAKESFKSDQSSFLEQHPLFSECGLSLAEEMLQKNRWKRISAREALGHEYFYND